jgi:DNA repair exonuclease SbcCD ATPase subunit
LKRTISAMRGPGSLKHNRRAFTAENVDAERTRYNVVYKDEPIKQVYHELFDDALERYNSKQKRKDRCISDYYEHLRTGKQEKVFHELIVKIGDKDNTGVTTEDGQWAATILDEYMQDFEKRNPTLRVFGAFLHMDEATPHLHIDFIPYVSGWKGKGMDTKVSLKQALKALGFAGGTKKESELNQWINAEKEQLAAVMERHGIEWEKKDTHEEHLSVLDFKKKERAKEVAELDAVKQEKQTELAQIQQQTQEAKRECQKQTKELNEIAPILQGLESLSAQYSQRPEEWVPEAGTFETAKSYRDKKAIPLINKLVKILYSLHHKYWKVKNECAKFMERYADEREANQNLRQRIEMLQEENTRLKAVEHNFGRVWSYYGAEQVKRVVELMAGRERAAQNVQRQKREHENVI